MTTVKTVWLVASHADLRRFLAIMLGSNGYDVVEHTDGPAVMAAFGNTALPQLLICEEPPPGLARSVIEARVREMAPQLPCVFLRDAPDARKPDEVRRFETDELSLSATDLLELLDRLVESSAPEVSIGSSADALHIAKESILTTVSAFMQILERYEFINGGNGPLVQRYAPEVAREMGLSPDRVEAIAAASLLYDVGMMRVRPDLKLKDGKLTDEELAIIRQHPRFSAEFCRSLSLPWDIERYVLHHHERYDGRGYPDGLAGKAIPIGARIIAVGDAYFAMIARRASREAKSEDDALRELTREAGLQFDPEVVEVWSSLIQVRFLGETADDADLPAKRIALIDDDRDLRVLLEARFTGLGYQLAPVTDPSAILSTLLEAKPEAILLNADLPWVDGLQLMHQVRQEPGLGGVPFIFMSARQASPADRARAAAAGADEYIIRPLPLQDLVSKVYGAIRKKTRITDKHFVRPPTSSGIRGRLVDMALTEICQILAQGSKTARVAVIDANEEGHIFFVDGKLKHASYGSLTGSEAFFAMLRIRDGDFAIDHGVGAPTETVQERLEFLLMEGMRLMDEERRPE